MVRIRHIEVPQTTPIESYRPFEGPSFNVQDLIVLGREVASEIGPRKVWMLNSTGLGGGVAEMMPRLCSLLTGLGVDVRWIVLEPEDPRFFVATKALHNMIHGLSGAVPTPELAATYDATSREGAAALRTLVNHDDVLVVHDPQPLGLARYLPADHRPRLIWRCHIGTSDRNAVAQEAWRFLGPYLDCYERLLFSSESFIPDELFAKSGVLLPSIDPLSHKNRSLRSYKLIGILRSAGLAPGPAIAEWARFEHTAQRFIDGQWEARPIDDLLYVPVILQVSRFDRLKGFHHLIPAFAQLLQNFPERVARMRVDSARANAELERTVMILAGADPSGVVDDPEAATVLKELCDLYQKQSPDVRRRLHLVKLPMENVKQNALAVNALQRQASLIMQMSLQEGFGLTVTEALWKGIPVVASSVGGLALQIRSGVDGFLVHDPTDECGLGEMMLLMLAYTRQAEKMAASAHARVREHFLVTNQVKGWLQELKGLLAKEHPAATSSPDPPLAQQAPPAP